MGEAMDTNELLKKSQQLAMEELAADHRERLRIIIDQLHLLQSDEQQAQDPAEIEERQRRLEAKLERLSRAVRPGDGGYREGAILAFRYAEDVVLREAIARGIEEGISRAIRATRALPEVELPELDVIGGGADLWFFSERPKGTAKADMLRAFLCLGLQIQQQLAAYGAVPAFLLDWEDDATYLVNPRGRTLLSRKLRSAQEALLGGKAGHILLSDDCRRSLSISLPGGVVQRPLRDSLASILGCSGAQLSCSVKELPALMPSKMSIPMVALTYSANNEVIAGGSLVYAEFTAIEHREDLPGRRRGELFIQRLATHDECVIIGITNEHLARQYLIPALADRSADGKGFWRRLVVIFASSEAAARLIEDRPAEDRVHRRAAGLRSVISFLRSEDPSANSWEVAEYRGDLPFVGNWLSGGSPNSIRLSPVLPGRAVDQTFTVELPESTVAYEEAKESFIVIQNRSRKVGEWNLLGRVDGGTFRWREIVSRSASPALVNPATYEAVILVLVHGMSRRGRRVYLQLRSNLNGSTDLGLYSNISGKVTVDDVYDAAGLRPPLLISPEEADALMGDILGQEVLRPGEEIPNKVWLRAAIREVEEELGLKVGESRLKDHGHLTLVRPERDTSLFFQVFSLELTSAIQDQRTVVEINEIRQHRPAAGMDKDFTLRDIRRLAEERSLNALLAANVDHFIEIYRSLEISDE
jgi:hypothetical protein